MENDRLLPFRLPQPEKPPSDFCKALAAVKVLLDLPPGTALIAIDEWVAMEHITLEQRDNLLEFYGVIA